MVIVVKAKTVLINKERVKHIRCLDLRFMLYNLWKLLTITPILMVLPIPPPYVRVYTVIPINGGATGAVAKGTFFSNYIPARILLDSGKYTYLLKCHSRVNWA